MEKRLLLQLLYIVLFFSDSVFTSVVLSPVLTQYSTTDFSIPIVLSTDSTGFYGSTVIPRDDLPPPFLHLFEWYRGDEW